MCVWILFLCVVCFVCLCVRSVYVCMCDPHRWYISVATKAAMENLRSGRGNAAVSARRERSSNTSELCHGVCGG